MSATSGNTNEDMVNSLGVHMFHWKRQCPNGELEDTYWTFWSKYCPNGGLKTHSRVTCDRSRVELSTLPQGGAGEKYICGVTFIIRTCSLQQMVMSWFLLFT